VGFFDDADALVYEFCDYIGGDEETDLGTDPARDSVLFDSEQLAKHHRKVWLQWARTKKSLGEEVPDGWLIEYGKQTKEHQEVQRMQAEALFALGYQAALHDMRRPTEDAKRKWKLIEPSKRATMQVFTPGEARLLIASFMAFVAYTLKRKKIVLQKFVVDRMLKKLEVLADVNLDHVEYFPLDAEKLATRVKPKWKQHKTSKRPFTKSRGLHHKIKRKAN
jgi:hypothetical protein